jgi:Fe-S-cluster-containing dehydrogenase component
VSKYGLLIDYDFCTGCHTCEVACQQEHDYPAGKCGIKVTEFITPGYSKFLHIDNVPFPTDLCDLCAQRTANGEKPSCVKHCQAACMAYGPLTELIQGMENRPKTVLFRPR